MHTSSYEIRVNHLDEAEKFYRFILQVKGKRQKGKRYFFKLPDLEIYLSERKERATAKINPEITIAVNHLEYYYARYRALDPRLVLRGMYETPGQFTTLDPFGNRLVWVQL
ncbi:MAG: VOC family protein [Saprospiraceae bacterium]|nr:VOC family protein [Saprospiraceae bacterium]MCB9318410.1 VOC family protein [Lewinellaceae bacterium]